MVILRSTQVVDCYAVHVTYVSYRTVVRCIRVSGCLKLLTQMVQWYVSVKYLYLFVAVLVHRCQYTNLLEYICYLAVHLTVKAAHSNVVCTLCTAVQHGVCCVM